MSRKIKQSLSASHLASASAEFKSRRASDMPKTIPNQENALTQAPPLWYVTAWGMLNVAEMMLPVKKSSGLAARISDRDSRRAILPVAREVLGWLCLCLVDVGRCFLQSSRSAGGGGGVQGQRRAEGR